MDLPNVPKGWYPSLQTYEGADTGYLFYSSRLFPGCIRINRHSERCEVFLNRAPMLSPFCGQTSVYEESNGDLDHNFERCILFIGTFEYAFGTLPAYQIEMAGQDVAYIWFYEQSNQIIISVRRGVFECLSEFLVKFFEDLGGIEVRYVQPYHDRDIITILRENAYDAFVEDFPETLAGILCDDAQVVCMKDGFEWAPADL